MNNNFLSTVIRLAIISLVLGLLLSFFSVNPQDLLEMLGSTALGIFNAVARVLEWSVQYILIGVIVVVPVWLVIKAWRVLRGK
ncbi:MAG TPA: hypothetical protein ENI69_10345 [Rhodospirillales bacterium]|nr:hypothetical protein [Rhodospirillales bacterium]